MADARHIVEIILQARDNTAAAFASAIGNQKAFNRLQEESERQAEETTRAHQKTAETVESATKRQTRSLEQLGIANKTVIDDAVRLERQTEKYVKTLRDSNTTLIQRKQAAIDLNFAETSLRQSIRDTTDATRDQARHTQERITAMSKERAALQGLAKDYEVAGKQVAARAREAEEAEKRRVQGVQNRANLLKGIENELNREIERNRSQTLRKLAQEDREDHRDRMDRRRKEIELERQQSRERQQQARRDSATGREHQRELQAAEKERIALLDEIEKRGKRLARIDLGADSARQARRELLQLRMEYVQLGGDQEKALRRQAAAIREARRDTQAMSSDAQKYLSTVQRIAQVEKERRDALKAGDQVSVVKLKLEEGGLRREAAKLATELNALLGKIEIETDIDTSGALTGAAEVLALKKAMGRDVKFEVNADVDRASAAVRRLGRDSQQSEGFIKGLNAAFHKGIEESAGKVAQFDNILRGLFALGITAFFSQLVYGAGAAAGALAALASSALYAGGALGGVLVAGVAQAIPALGLLAATMSRVKQVTEAVGQANLLQEQQSYAGAGAAKAQADANDTLVAATDRVTEAQERVTEARKDARREIEELILAERRATLSVSEAQEALRASVQQGRVGDLESRRLSVREARFRLSTTREDLATARTRPGVADAQENVQEAQRAAQRAQRGAAAAGDDMTAAAGKLNFLLASLSSAERRLYTALTRLQDAWRKFSQEATAPLVNAFATAVDRITDLLGDNRILASARGLSAQLAAQFSRIFSVFTSGDVIGQWMRIIRQAGQNLRPLTSIVINLGRAFLDIAEAAGPSLSLLLGWIQDLSRDFRILVRNAKEGGQLGSFFEEGTKHIKAWVELLGSVGRLFLAIAGPGGGAKQGLNLIESLTDGINNFADAVGTRGSRANKFFRDLFAVMREVGRAFKIIFSAIADEMAKLFGEEAGSGGASIRGFARIVANILVPAFFTFLRLTARITRAIGELVDEHPKLARFAGLFLSFGLVYSVLGRFFALFTPFRNVLAFIIGRLGIAKGLLELISKLRFGLLFNPWVIFAGIIFIVIQRLGLLDDIFRAVKKAVQNFIEAAAPGFKDFTDAVKELVDAFEGGDGLFGTFRSLVTFLVRVLLPVIEEVGRFLGEYLGDIFKILGGAIRVFVRLLKGDFRGALDALIDIGKAIVHALVSPFRLVGRILGRIFGGVLERIGNFIGDIIDAFAGAAGGIQDAFSGIGDFIAGVFGGVVEVLVDVFNFIIDSVNVVIAAINAIPNIPGVGGIPHIDPIDHIDSPGDIAAKRSAGRRQTGRSVTGGGGTGAIYRQEGGRIGAGYGGGDRVLLAAEEGEYVIRKEAVSHWGEGVMDFLNTLGGSLGFKRKGRGFREGGAVRGAQGAGDVEATAEETRDIMQILRRFGRVAVAQWREVWRDLNVITRRGLNRMEESVSDGFRDMLRIFNRRGKAMVESMRGTMRNVMNSVFTGMDYVGDATSEALEVFDAKVPKLSVPRPRDLTRASGGYVGQPGERGRDQIRTVLGRGEAVLNWGQQKVVNSALWNQYGTTLDGLFKTMTAYHGGGPGQQGFAGGGFTGPAGSGAGFIPISNFAMNKFGLSMTSGRTDHSQYTASNNVSDHYRGLAGDFSNGVLTPQEDAFSNFWLKKAPQVIKQLIWRNADQQQGFYVGGHEDHVHLAVQPQYGFNSELMAKIISRAARGLSIASLMRGGAGTGSFDVDHVAKIPVEGSGPLQEMVQNVINLVRNAANKFIDKKAMQDMGAFDLGASHRDYDGPLNRVFPSHGLGQPGARLSPAQVTEIARAAGFSGKLAVAMEQIAHGESDYYPGIVSYDGGYGLWQMTPRVWGAEGIAQMNSLGGVGAMLNPFKNALMAKYLYQSAGNSFTPWYGTKYLTAMNKGGYAGEFAQGGVIPGGEGDPMHAVVHSGEWILNRQQQKRLSHALGATTSSIKRLLGFSGRATSSYAEGGEVIDPGVARMRQIRKGEYELPPLPLEALSGILRETRLVYRAINNLKRKSKDFSDKFIANMSELTKENGLFDQITANTERFIENLETRMTFRQFRFRRGLGIVQRRALDTPSELGEAEQRNLRLTGRRLGRDADVFARAGRRVDREMAGTRRQIRRLSRGGLTEDEEETRTKLISDFEDLFAQHINIRDRRQALNQSIAENLQARFDAAQEAMQRRLDRGERPVAAAERAMREIENRGGLTSTKGQAGQEAVIAALRQQQDLLTRVAKRARSRGMREFAQQIEDQIADLNLTIQEATLNLVRSQVEAVQNVFASQEFLAGLAERYFAVQGGLGNTLGAAQGAANVLQFRRAAINQQIGGLSGLLGAAQGTGNAELIQDLSQQIADLTIQLEENTLALRDANTAIRQVLIDQLTRSATFRTGGLGTLGQILQTIGDISGTPNTEAQAELVRQTIGVITSTGAGFRDQLFKWMGIDVRGLTGPDFVNAMTGVINNFDTIMAGLSATERDQFELLINAILENENALWQNTNTLNELVGATKEPQTWASSAWSWYREALFSGMGEILPQFEPTSMQTGGQVTRGGAFNLHPGEFVFNPANGQGMREGDVNIEINEAGGPIDTQNLASRLAFAKKNGV